MNSKILIVLIAVVSIAALGFITMLVQRQYHNYQRKRASVNTYAIQNVKTGMDIRPFNAGIADEVRIIQYKHKEWECMTWQFIKLEDGSYLLKNLYTQKTFQPKVKPTSGVALWQQPIEANSYQYWVFEKHLTENAYKIRLKGTELFVTVSSEKNNTEIILMPLQNTKEQLWNIVEQHPIM